MKIIVGKNKDDIFQKTINLIENVAKESIAKDNIFKIGLSGGSVATFLTIGIPKIKTDFTKWKLFFCDERNVPEDSNDSTYGFYKSALIGTSKLTEDHFIRIKQGVSAKEAAADYTEQLKRYFPGETVPKFHLLLLGMGPDGHTCSLFPNHPLLEETDEWIAAITDSPKPPSERITMTFKVVNNSKNCVFVVCGKEKAGIVKRILHNKEDLPASRVNPTSGEVYWMLDEEAAGDLQKINED
ncbi:hypothetical protein WA026_020910 [Henosepilachna vigintioctopunctata]|uniref:6-phosphogluconolactonase n=1 Tax=Henosepilachna vigintioctopunctata TaxID=420089 RepID=A0AAW1UFM3_9CUCU